MSRTTIAIAAIAVAGLAVLLAGQIQPSSNDVASPSAGAPAPSAARDTPVYQYRVVATYPHDRKAFTQGLLYRDGVFYESTGLYGESSLRRVDIESGKVLRRKEVDGRLFAEGLGEWSKTLVQLTWKSGVAIVYDRDTFEEIKRLTYSGEGWGLTQTSDRFVMSDGSQTLKFLEPATFGVVSKLDVHDEHGPVTSLNELEMVRGSIYANVWQSERIAIIAPDSGKVTGWLDLHGLLSPAERAQVDVLNGIAYDEQGDRLFVTGKWWPTVFQIEVIKP